MPSRAASVSAGALDSMGAMNLMGGLGEESAPASFNRGGGGADLMGGMDSPARNGATAGGGFQSPDLMGNGPTASGALPNREQLRRNREMAKQASINLKVESLRAAHAQERHQLCAHVLVLCFGLGIVPPGVLAASSRPAGAKD